MISSMYRYETYKLTSCILKEIFNNQKDYFVIHYSCESFYGDISKSPRITAIAVQNYSKSQIHLFSVHKELEICNFDMNIDDAEKEMLSKYFNFVNEHKDKYWIHWNMRDSNYGFLALEHRYTVLFKTTPFQILDDKKVDLSRLLKNRYTNAYIGHPRMSKLAKKNNISKSGFLEGKDEAEAFDKKEFNKLSHSTSAKVELLSEILTLTIENTLKTESSLFSVYGKNFIGLFYAFKNKWYGELLTGLFLILLGGWIGKFF